MSVAKVSKFGFYVSSRKVATREVREVSPKSELKTKYPDLASTCRQCHLTKYTCKNPQKRCIVIKLTANRVYFTRRACPDGNSITAKLRRTVRCGLKYGRVPLKVQRSIEIPWEFI